MRSCNDDRVRLRPEQPLHCLPAVLLSLAMLLPVSTVQADESQTIRIPHIEEHPDGHNFYADVLTAALAHINSEYTLEVVGPVTQIRAQSMLLSGALDVLWAIQSPERDDRYLPTGVGITNSLIGHRVLLIRPEDRALFQSVDTLYDFRELGLTAGFGTGWIDAEIWAANDLDFYEEQGNWRVIFQKLARDRGDFDYLSRSIKEVLPELAANPQLSLERRLLLLYDRDETFYVSPENPELRDALAEALSQVQDSGELQRLIRQYWGTQLDALKVSDRTVIHLETP